MYWRLWRIQAFGVVDRWLCVAACFWCWFPIWYSSIPSLAYLSSVLSLLCRALRRSQTEKFSPNIRWPSDWFLYGIERVSPLLEGVNSSSTAIILSHRIIVVPSIFRKLSFRSKVCEPPSHSCRSKTALTWAWSRWCYYSGICSRDQASEFSAPGRSDGLHTRFLVLV